MESVISDTSSYLAHNITNLRKSRQLSQDQLAKISSIPRSTIANFESGSGNPSLANLVLLAKSLEVQVSELLARPLSNAELIKRENMSFKRKGECVIYNLLPSPVKGLGIEKFELGAGEGFAGVPHLKGTKEYFTCIQGKARVAVSGEEFIVNKGDVLIFSGDEKHSYFNIGKSTAFAISILVNS